MDDIARMVVEGREATKAVEAAPDFYEIVKAGCKRISISPPIAEGDKFSTYNFESLCPWEEVLCAVHGVSRKEVITPARMMPLRIGSAYHHMIQNDFFPNQEIRTRIRTAGSRTDVVVVGEGSVWLGWWKCCNCGSVIKGPPGNHPYDDWITKPLACQECESSSKFDFEEPECSRGMFMSHSDGGILFLGDKWHVELKTCSHDNFVGRFGIGYMKRPSEEHVTQVMLNQYTTGIRKSMLVYIDKGADSPAHMFATHVVIYDETRIKRLIVKAKAILEGVRYKALPRGEEWRTCRGADATRAKTCPVADRCPVVRPELARDADFFIVSDDVS